MQFSDSSGGDGIVEDIDFLCRTTSASYPVADKTRNINQAYHDVSRLIWDCADGWQYDDRNKSDLPKYLKTMVHGTQDVTVPSTAQAIDRVEVEDDDGSWHKLTPIDYRDISQALEEFKDVDGLPTHYDLVGNYLTLYPAPSSAYCTLTSGLAIRVARDVTEFATSATTAVPGFATQFHRILSLSSALDFEQDAGQRALFAQMKDRLERGLRGFYSHRETERRGEMRPYGKRRWRQYL